MNTCNLIHLQKPHMKHFSKCMSVLQLSSHLVTSKPNCSVIYLHTVCVLYIYIYIYNWCVYPEDVMKMVETCWIWSFSVLIVQLCIIVLCILLLLSLCNYLCVVIEYMVGWSSVVSMANHYRLNGPGIESQWGLDFPHPSRLALGPTQPPVQWVPGHSWGSKVAGAWLWPPTPI
jgi:hypothetical protein